METRDLFEYTLMPMHNRSMFEIRELMSAELYRGLRFTKGAPLLRMPALKDAKRSPVKVGLPIRRHCFSIPKMILKEWGHGMEDFKVLGRIY